MERDQDFSFRPASLDDLDALFAIHRAALGDYVEATWGRDEAWQLEFFREGFDAYVRSVIEVGGKPIGFLAPKRTL